MPISSQNTTVLYGKIAMAAYLRNVTPRFAQDMANASVLSSTSKVYYPSLENFDFQLDGLFDSTTGAGSLLNEITSNLGSATATAATVAPNGFALGNSAWLIPSITATYEVTSSVADLVGFSLNLSANGPANYGVCLSSLVALTATGTSTSHDNTTSTANGALINLHVTAASGTSPTMTMVVQHSTNNSTWTTLGTFTALTATGSQALQVTGTVNRYVRLSYTIGGTTPSFTTQVSIARI